MSLLSAASAIAGGVADTLKSGVSSLGSIASRVGGGAGGVDTRGAASVKSSYSPPPRLLPSKAASVGAGAGSIRASGTGLGSGLQAVAQSALDSGGAGRRRLTGTRAGMEVATTQAALRHGVPPSLMLGLVTQESQWDPTVTSSEGAKGLAQLIPKYFPGVDVNDPVANVNAGAGFLASLRKKYGNWQTALAAYNAGPTREDAILKGKATTPAETADYVKKVMGYAKAYGFSGDSSTPLSAQAAPSTVLPAKPWFATPAPLTPESMNVRVADNGLIDHKVSTYAIDQNGNPIFPSNGGIRVVSINPDGTDKATGYALDSRGNVIVPPERTVARRPVLVADNGSVAASGSGQGNSGLTGNASVFAVVNDTSPATAMPSTTDVASALTNSLGIAFGFVKDQAVEAGTAVQSTAETAATQIAATAPGVGAKLGSAVTDAAFQSVQSRSAIIDPMIASIFTNKTGPTGSANRYGATAAERATNASKRNDLTTLSPPSMAVATDLSTTPADAVAPWFSAPAPLTPSDSPIGGWFGGYTETPSTSTAAPTNDVTSPASWFDGFGGSTGTAPNYTDDSGVAHINVGGDKPVTPGQSGSPGTTGSGTSTPTASDPLGLTIPGIGDSSVIVEALVKYGGDLLAILFIIALAWYGSKQIIGGGSHA